MILRFLIDVKTNQNITWVKRIRFVFGLLITLLVTCSVSYGQNGSYVRTVVIDAGHGGKDPGALGRNSREKDIALAIALKTGAYIEQYLDDVKVIYTRKTDKFIELHKRADIANKNNADMFISIHCNANTSPKPYGTETYVMGLHKTKANLEQAKKENAAILLEEDYQEQYDGFDPNSDEGYIALSILQNAHLDQSIEMAGNVQQQFRDRVGLKDRSVRQAGFLVLYKTTMPGILVETGFLSNSKDEKFLLSEKGQTYLASAIYRAFRDYKVKMEGSNSPSREDIPVVRKEEKPTEENKPTIPKENKEVYLTVQIFTSPKQVAITKKNFYDYKNVSMYKHQGNYKYVYGKSESLEEVKKWQNLMRRKGFKGAFAIGFHNDKRITVSEALDLLDKK